MKHSFSSRAATTATLLALLVALLVAPFVAPFVAPSNAALATTQGSLPNASPFRAIQANIAGGYWNDGYAALPHVRTDGTSALDTLNAQITGFHPDAVMVEEVCASQRDLFARQHPAWALAYVPMRQNNPACGDLPQGQLLASPWPMGRPIVIPLGDTDDDAAATDDKVFTLLCADLTTPGGTVRACVTHLHAFSTLEAAEVRIRQVRTIASHVRAWIAEGRRVVLGGDLNSRPRTNTLDPLYAVMREADSTDPRWQPRPCRCGEPTLGDRKVDYVFYSRTPPVSGGVIDSPVSDHRVLRGIGWLK